MRTPRGRENKPSARGIEEDGRQPVATKGFLQRVGAVHEAHNDCAHDHQKHGNGAQPVDGRVHAVRPVALARRVDVQLLLGRGRGHVLQLHDLCVVKVLTGGFSRTVPLLQRHCQCRLSPWYNALVAPFPLCVFRGVG